jgi:transposase
VPRVERIEFRIHVGQCQHCGGRVQGRHRRQTSDAIGSTASQLGPRIVALATQLNKGLGLPYGKTAAVLEEAFGLRVSRAGLCQALDRVAHKAEPTYAALVEQSPRQSQCDPR